MQAGRDNILIQALTVIIITDIIIIFTAKDYFKSLDCGEQKKNPILDNPKSGPVHIKYEK